MKYRLEEPCPGPRWEDGQGPERSANPHTSKANSVQVGLGSGHDQVTLRPEKMETVTPTSVHMVVVKIERGHI